MIVIENMESRMLLSAGVSSRPPVTPPAEPVVYAPHSTVAGKTMAEWTEAWWQWAYSYPVESSPFVQGGPAAKKPADVPMGLGDVGDAYFLAGAIVPNYAPPVGEPLTAYRQVTIPDDVPVFFPVMNAEDSIWEENVFRAPDNQVSSVNELWTIVDGWLASPPPGKFAQIDRLSLDDAGVDAHREKSTPDGFEYTLPANHIITVFGYPDPEPGDMPTLAVSDGWWLMTRPLKRGNHTIVFGGGDASAGFALRVTYDVKVVSRSHYDRLVADANPVAVVSPSVFSAKQIKDLDAGVLA
jgi:hypothetical protein